jgi:hypothetical protein
MFHAMRSLKTQETFSGKAESIDNHAVILILRAVGGRGLCLFQGLCNATAVLNYTRR